MCQHSCLSALFRGCFPHRLEKHVSQQWARPFGSDCFHPVRALALTLQLLLKSTRLIAGAKKHPPFLLAHLQPTHVCSPSAFLPPAPDTLYTKDFPSIHCSVCFEATVPFPILHRLTTSTDWERCVLCSTVCGAQSCPTLQPHGL